MTRTSHDEVRAIAMMTILQRFVTIIIKLPRSRQAIDSPFNSPSCVYMYYAEIYVLFIYWFDWEKMSTISHG